MSEQTYLVLLALADEPRHGYGVVQEVRTLSDDRVKLGAGTLYGILDRLVAAGQAEVSNEVVVEGRLRRYYRLTPGGRAVVEAHTAELAALARRARRVLARPAFGGV
ncbi:MAG: PadR family transcriptional regulator [Actinobacteria bacterium]|nr:PadR family transcriptional regulator [Actinomycetota bacterium]